MLLVTKYFRSLNKLYIIYKRINEKIILMYQFALVLINVYEMITCVSALCVKLRHHRNTALYDWNK